MEATPLQVQTLGSRCQFINPKRCSAQNMNKIYTEKQKTLDFSAQSHLTLCDPMHGLQHARLLCPSPTPWAYSNSCPESWCCHSMISSSLISSSCLQSFPASGSFQMRQLFASGGQNIGVSASASVLPMNIQDWFPLGLTGLISLQSKGISRVFSNTTVQKHQFFSAQLSVKSNSHIHTWLMEKPQLWLYGHLSAKWCLCLLIRCLGLLLLFFQGASIF